MTLYSTVTGEVEDGLALDAAYWVRNLRQPVLLSKAVERCSEDDHEVFVEVSPHPVLLGSVEQCLRHHGREGFTLPSLRENEGQGGAPWLVRGALHAGAPGGLGQALPLQRPVRPAAVLPLSEMSASG